MFVYSREAHPGEHVGHHDTFDTKLAFAPYVSEQLEFRDVDREAFYARLQRNGPRAYTEFRRAEEIWRERD